MDKVITVAQVIAPIFAAIFLGQFARRKQLLTREGVQGMQQFVMKFGLPCVGFNSYLTAELGAESLTSMLLVLPAVLLGTFWAFRARKKQFPYVNLPQLFSSKETGMLGIPLFMILFGAGQAYRMGVLDLAQAVTAMPVIALLSAKTTKNPTTAEIIKKVLFSPLLFTSFLGLGLNITGIGSWLDGMGIGGIITECTGFLAQPVSAMMLFSVGYNFSLDRENRRDIFCIAGIHFGLFTVAGMLAQGILFLVPNVDVLTRWALLLYFTLPASYLAPTLGRSEADNAVASGVCSLLTVVSLLVFCAMAVAVA